MTKKKPPKPPIIRIQKKSLKASRGEVELRITEVYKLIVNGLATWEINRYAAEKWGLSEESVNMYIRRARARFVEEAKFDRERELGKAIARHENLLKHNMRVKDYKGALATERSRIKLLGLDAPTRTEISGPNGGAINVSDARAKLFTLFAPSDEEPTKGEGKESPIIAD